MPERNLPDTSHEAYRKLKSTDERERHHAKIIEALQVIGMANYERIAAASGLEKHQVGRRLSELERDGKVYKSGVKLPTSNNVNAYAYQLMSPSSQPLNTAPLEGKSIADYSKGFVQKNLFD